METVSILIPTRNRPALARLAAEAALVAADEHCEIIVADNSDVCLELPQDPRLRHLLPEGVLSMPDNWERALQAASGDWLLLLADKYMLVPGALAALRRLMTTDRAVVSYGLAQLRQGLAPGSDETLDVLRTTGGRLSWPTLRMCLQRDSREDICRLVASARYPRNYPMLYTAAVRRELLVRATRGSGRFFLGSCPDVCSALQILAHSSQWITTQEPVILAQYPSASARWSTGTSALEGGALAQGFFSDLGVPTPTIEKTIAGAVFATMRAFGSRRPDLPLPLEEGLVSFARQMSWEIEGMAPWRRLAAHARLLGYTQRGGPRLAAALAQARAALAMCVPRRLRIALAARRDTPEPGPEGDVPVANCDVADRQEAFDRVSARLAESS